MLAEEELGYPHEIILSAWNRSLSVIKGKYRTRIRLLANLLNFVLKEKTREYNARKHHTNAISLTGVCIHCGKTFSTSNLKNRTFRHHIIPKEYEIHSEENLIELCNHCHASLHRFEEKLLWKLVPHKKIVEEIERFLDLDLSSLKQLLQKHSHSGWTY